MRVYNISYDLNSPGQDYMALHDAIRALSGSWARPLLSTWLVATNMTAAQIAQRLSSYMDGNDKILVTELRGPWAAYNLPQAVVDWLHVSMSAPVI